MASSGVEPGDWLLPVFICEELQGPKILPVFFNPRDIAATWVAAGRKPDDMPDKFVMMDVRMLMREMKKPGMPWSKVQFIGAQGAAEFANELQAAKDFTYKA
jgi:hypothetical protein